MLKYGHIQINGRKRIIYMKNGSQKKYIIHKKKHIALTDYKKIMKGSGCFGNFCPNNKIDIYDPVQPATVNESILAKERNIPLERISEEDDIVSDIHETISETISDNKDLEKSLKSDIEQNKVLLFSQLDKIEKIRDTSELTLILDKISNKSVITTNDIENFKRIIGDKYNESKKFTVYSSDNLKSIEEVSYDNLMERVQETLLIKIMEDLKKIPTSIVSKIFSLFRKKKESDVQKYVILNNIDKGNSLPLQDYHFIFAINTVSKIFELNNLLIEDKIYKISKIKSNDSTVPQQKDGFDKLVTQVLDKLVKHMKKTGLIFKNETGSIISLNTFEYLLELAKWYSNIIDIKNKSTSTKKYTARSARSARSVRSVRSVKSAKSASSASRSSRSRNYTTS